MTQEDCAVSWDEALAIPAGSLWCFQGTFFPLAMSSNFMPLVMRCSEMNRDVQILRPLWVALVSINVSSQKVVLNKGPSLWVSFCLVSGLCKSWSLSNASKRLCKQNLICLVVIRRKIMLKDYIWLPKAEPPTSLPTISDHVGWLALKAFMVDSRISSSIDILAFPKYMSTSKVAVITFHVPAYTYPALNQQHGP